MDEPVIQHRGVWNTAVVVFAYRETIKVLVDTLEAARFGTDESTVIEVLVNGNSALAETLAGWAVGHASDWTRLRIWSIDYGDKANAWNQYFHKLWHGESQTFFIDGYVTIRHDAVRLLSQTLMNNPHAWGGCGIPSGSRSANSLAAQMLDGGGFHGNFCCIKGTAIEQIKRRNILLPIGLYRTDSLVGALLAFGLDPARNKWDARKLIVAPQVTWDTPPKYWWRYADIKAEFKRKFRQSKGDLENAAVKNFLVQRKEYPENLPRTIQEMLAKWIDCFPEDLKAIRKRNIFMRFYLRSCKNKLHVNEEKLLPSLMWCGLTGR